AHDRHVAQVLLTHADLADRRRYLNARHTLRTLLDLGIVPIVNENDTVAVEELAFGDNDNLSALTASLVEADLLVILSDVEGLHARDPRLDPGAPLVRVARAQDASVTRAAGPAQSGVGTGGMASKLAAARQAAAAGIPPLIADRTREGVLAACAASVPTGASSPAASSITARPSSRRSRARTRATSSACSATRAATRSSTATTSCCSERRPPRAERAGGAPRPWRRRWHHSATSVRVPRRCRRSRPHAWWPRSRVTRAAPRACSPARPGRPRTPRCAAPRRGCAGPAPRSAAPTRPTSPRRAPHAG